MRFQKLQDMVVVRKTVLDHEAAVLLQPKVTAKMNDKIILNNEGDALPKQQNQVQSINGGNVKEKPRALLLCQPNSHPFQPRNIIFDPAQEVKVGRSITRTKIADNNAVFDCKVLSRNHALLWYNEGKFFLRDTGSSNGTFINNQRLSSNSTSSEPYEIRTDDVVQFGVDVMENNKKETHGCIVALVKLFVPEGEECKTGRMDSKTDLARTIPATDLCRLNQYLQEAIQREQILETKLFNLQKIMETTRENSKSTWHAMIEEDRLLSRIDILENKLLYLQKNVTDDKLRDEMMKLLEEKCVYQNSAKKALSKIYQERNEAVQKLSTMERSLCSSEDECSLLRDQLLRSEENLQTAISQLATTEEIRSELSDQLQRSDLRESQKDLEIRNLYEQIKMQTQQNKEVMDAMETLTYEKDLLQERLKKLGPKRNTSHTIMSWLENSNLAGMASGKNIMNAICNEDDNEQTSLSETHEKLLAIEKQIASFEVQLNGSDTTESIKHLENKTPLTSDGNQNNQQCPDEVILSKSNNSSSNDDSNNELNQKSLMKTTINHMKEVCAELCSQVVSMKSNLKEKISTDEVKSVDDEDDDDDDENGDKDKTTPKVSVAMYDKDESRTNNESLFGELQASRRIIAELEKKLESFNACVDTKKVTVETDTEDLNLLNAFNDSCETLHHSSVENLHIRKTVDAVIQTNLDVNVNQLDDSIVAARKYETNDQLTHIDSDLSQFDHSIPDKNLDLELNTVADDVKMLCDPNVEREEQLIAFKEHCAELTNSNLQLKNQVNELQLKLSHGQSTISSRLAFVAPIAVAIICWLILPYL